MDDDLKELMELVKRYNPKADFRLIEKAYEFAKHAHKGQMRMSGKEFHTHPAEVAKIMTEWEADTSAIAAALLHDVVEDSKIEIKKIEKDFGKEIAHIVEGETKLRKIVFESREDYTAENIRKVLLASIKDIRVILIKFADRLHNMRTLKYFPEAKQRRIAKETMEIYAPLAHKLGMYSLKGELEDLSLRFLEPAAYQDLKNKINEKRTQREEKAKILMQMIRDKLKENNIPFIEVSGRAKYFYSIYKKMLRDNKSFDEIYDLIAVRVIVRTIPDCYRVLALIHQVWKPIPGRLKDYIAVPKSNRYQSLHTDVVTQFGSVLEVQIRTLDMHYVAKYGVAAHWRYKGTDRDKKFDRRIAWLEQILDWKKKAATDFLSDLKVDLFQDEIVVFTPKGEPIILPEKSTPVDFAYEVHTGIGNHCVKAEVNAKLVSLDTELHSGDIIRIITSNKASPSRNWLSFVKTNKARQKIRQSLDIEPDTSFKQEDKKSKKSLDIKKFIKHEGKKAPIKISKCCSPAFNDKIVAFRTKDNSITVHKVGCPNIHALDQRKKVKVWWSIPKKKIRNIYIYTQDQIGLIESILNSLTTEKVPVLSINIKDKKGNIVINMKIKEDGGLDIKEVKALIEKFDKVNKVEIR